MPQQKFAVFDIDGTLIRWQLYHAVADELGRQGHLELKALEQINATRMLWKKRQSEDSFKEYERALVRLVDPVFQKISVEDFLEACRVTIEEYKDQVYTYTRDLIRELKAKNYLLFAISGSQAEIVEMLASYYGFDDFDGSRFEIKDGKFTGKKTVLASSRKPEVLERLVKKHSATYEGSIGIGDSESDIEMLEAVENRIAFNPTKQLFDYSKKRGWKIVVERKNMVYELKKEVGNYMLKSD